MRSMCWAGLGAALGLFVLVVPIGCEPPTPQLDHHDDYDPNWPGIGSTGHTDDDATYDPPDEVAGEVVGTGTIVGTIIDAETGAPLEGVEVALADADHSAWTDGDGNFSLSNVPAGSHYLTYKLAGYVGLGTNVTVVADAVVEVTGTLIELDLDTIGSILMGGAAQQ